MSSIARGPDSAISLEIYIKKIQSILDMHRVEFGAPENLPVFLKRLREDRHLAMDFWALTAAISTSEGGELPNDQMLELIVRGVAGKDLAEVRQSGDDEMKQTLDDLGRLLAGVDLDSPTLEAEDAWPVTEQDTWPPSPNKPVPQQPVSVFSRINSVPPIEKPSEPVFDEPAADRVIDTAPAQEQVRSSAEAKLDDVADAPKGSQTADVPFSVSPELSKQELDEALSRLEKNNRDLRLHLEKISSRMNRIEPHLEELKLKVTTSPDDAEERFNEARSDGRAIDSNASQAIRSDRRDSNTKPRLVLLNNDDDPSIHVPLSGYERGSGSRAMRVFLPLLLVLGGLYFVQHTYGAQLRERYAPRLQLLFHQTYDAVATKLRSSSSEKQAAAVVASSDDPMSSTTSPSEESLHAAPPSSAIAAAATPDPDDTETASAAPPAPSPSVSSPPPTVHPATAPPAAASPASTPPAPAVTTENPHEALVTRSPREPLTGRGAGRVGHGPADTGDFTRAAGRYNPAEIPVNVPPAVMQENLITSRVPAYPQAAKTEGIEGWVVMQAIISKNGTVDQLHVIQGDPLLRAAASEAVSRWHYRPYTVNGRPVDVATIVKVEFKLPRQY
jgi:TonB family protein